MTSVKSHRMDPFWIMKIVQQNETMPQWYKYLNGGQICRLSVPQENMRFEFHMQLKERNFSENITYK